MDVKQAILSLAFLLTAALAHAQLTLDECRRQAAGQLSVGAPVRTDRKGM